MTLIFWIVNFASLFSSVGTAILLLIISLRFRKPGFYLLFLFLVSLSLNYALGMFQILGDAGALVMPPREYIKILFARPTAASLVREVFVVLISLSAPAGVLSLLGKPLGRSLLPLAGGLMILEILPLAVLFSAESMEGWRIQVVVASRLLLYYGPLFYAMVLPLRQSTEVRGAYPRGVVTLLKISCLLVLPAMLLEDLLMIYEVIPPVNMVEAVSFLFLTSSIIIVSLLELTARKTSVPVPDGEKISDFVVRHSLTQREEQILRALIDGLSYKEAAERLHISPDTVKTHVKNLYRKSGMEGRQALRLYFRKT
jgi:DNA-binding CsgD family transcriptional regulator